MNRPKRVAGLAVLVLAVAARAEANSLAVTLDTSPLSGPQTLAFSLTNFNSASNTLTLSGFDFDGGSVVTGSEDCTLGGTFSGLGCSGDLITEVVLEDLDPTATFFTQQFSPGDSLSFVLTATNSFGGGTPDQFAMFICDGSLSTCYSDDASGAMLLLDLVGGSLSPSSFVLFGSTLVGLSSPAVTAAPEPSVLLLLAGGLSVVIARLRRGSLQNR